ncbi:MAG: hypothetical protein ABH821_03090, partial [archaeon]
MVLLLFDDTDFVEKVDEGRVGRGPFESGDYSDFGESRKLPIGAIIVLIIVVAVGFGIAYFFFLNFSEVSVSVVDFEGSSVNASIEVYNAGGELVDSFKGSQSLRLSPGEYSFKVKAPGYRVKTDYYTVEPVNLTELLEPMQAELEIMLEKNLQLSFEALNNPSTIFLGSNFSVSFNLRNNSASSVSTQLVLEGAFKEAVVSIEPSSISVPGGSVLPIVITFSLPEDFSISGSGVEDFIIRLLGTSQKQVFSSSVVKMPVLSLLPQTIEETLQAGESLSKKITIDNSKNKVIISSISGSITDFSSQFNDSNLLSEWIYFSQSVSSIPASSKAETIIDFSVPQNAVDDTITGVVQFSTGFWTGLVPFTLIVEALNYSLSLNIPESFSISFDSVSQAYNINSERVKVTNSGEIDLTGIDINVALQNPDDNCLEFVSFLSNTFFNSLPAGESEDFYIQVTAPETQEAGVVLCVVQATY